MSLFDTSHMNSSLAFRCNYVHILYSIACYLVFLSPGDAVWPIALNCAWTERHCHAYKTPRSMYTSIYNSFPVIRTTIAKNHHFTYPGLHFLFALGTPLWKSRKTLHEWKDDSVLAKPLAACTHLSSTVSQLFKPQVQKKTPFSRTAAHIFVSLGDAPAIVTQYVAWMERQFNACQTPRSMRATSSIVSELYDA